MSMPSAKYALGALALAACAAGALAAESSEAPMVAHALELLARASSTSEVLTLNLTNLLILGILAGAVIVFGAIASDDLAAQSRSAKSPADVINQTVVTGGMCFMMYTSGDDEKLECIQRSACEDPKTAVDYLTAAKMWYKMHKLMKVVPFTDGYYNIMTAVQDATEHSINGGDCTKYQW